MPRQNLNRDAAPAIVVRAVEQLGANIATARLRRRWRQADLAARAGVTRPTIARIEAGELGTGIGAYVAVLWALGLHAGVVELAAPHNDPEGEALAAAHLGERARTSNKLSDDF